jgi:hypothetical protein
MKKWVVVSLLLSGAVALAQHQPRTHAARGLAPADWRAHDPQVVFLRSELPDVPEEVLWRLMGASTGAYLGEKKMEA